MIIIWYVIVWILTAIFGSIWEGYVLSVLWRWFIIPAFGAPTLSIPFAIGVAIVVGYLTKQVSSSKDKRPGSEQLIECVALATIRPAFALLFGWVVTWFIK